MCLLFNGNIQIKRLTIFFIKKIPASEIRDLLFVRGIVF